MTINRNRADANEFNRSKIFKLRTAAGISQRDLMWAAKVGENTVARWDRGAQPGPENVEKLCKIFGCTPADILEEPGGPKYQSKD